MKTGCVRVCEEDAVRIYDETMPEKSRERCGWIPVVMRWRFNLFVSLVVQRALDPIIVVDKRLCFDQRCALGGVCRDLRIDTLWKREVVVR